MKNFNDIKTFNKDIIELLSSLIQDKLKQTIEFCVQTHDIKPLIIILESLEKFKF